MNQAFGKLIVGDIVAKDFRAAAVFQQFGIDFCCGGQRSIADACEMASVAPSDVEAELTALTAVAGAEDKVAGWPLDRLADHIESTHHTYVRTALPVIRGYLAKLVNVHGVRHPELVSVLTCFDTLARNLLQHMIKEEQVLFPYVRELQAVTRSGYRRASPFGSIENPIRMMEREHRGAADELDTIRELTCDYTAPSDGCTTYRVCMAELQRFEDDLHRHVHLENNVLFPRAIALEQGSAG
jgi:regulator of cell morphogenesis and NO signaling